VLCLHGLTGSPDELTPLSQALAAAGFTVATPMLSGHGRDVAALAKTTRFDWIASADAALTELITACGAPVAIVGSSAGGLIALQLASARPRDVHSLVFLSTPVLLPAREAIEIGLALRVPAALRPKALAEIRKPHGPNVDDRTFAAALRSLPAYPIEALGELLQLMRAARAGLGSVTQRVMIAHGALDATVSRAQVDVLANGLTGAAVVERLDLPASAHLLAIDRDRDLLAAHVVKFLRAAT
jgi:carboxylesterase